MHVENKFHRQKRKARLCQPDLNHQTRLYPLKPPVPLLPPPSPKAALLLASSTTCPHHTQPITLLKTIRVHTLNRCPTNLLPTIGKTGRGRESAGPSKALPSDRGPQITIPLPSATHWTSRNPRKPDQHEETATLPATPWELHRHSTRHGSAGRSGSSSDLARLRFGHQSKLAPVVRVFFSDGTTRCLGSELGAVPCQPGCYRKSKELRSVSRVF